MSALTAPTCHTPKRDRRRENLTDHEKGLALEWTDKGIPQTEIAQRLGCDQSTISKMLDRLTLNTNSLARMRAQRDSLPRVERLIEWSGKPTDLGMRATKELNEIAELKPNQSVSVNNHTMLIIGGPGSPALEAQDIVVQTVNHNDGYQTQRESVGLTGQSLTAATNVASEAKGGGER